MATEFKTIRDFVRPVLGDTDAQRLLYSDNTLNQHIRLLILKEDDPEIQEGAEGEFATALTAKQKALTVYRTARSVLSGQPDEFSYKGPVMSASRKGGVLQLLAYIDRQISDIEGGETMVLYDTELDALLNGAYRFMQDLSDAQANL